MFSKTRCSLNNQIHATFTRRSSSIWFGNSNLVDNHLIHLRKLNLQNFFPHSTKAVTVKDPENATDLKNARLVFEGPNYRVVRLLKFFSISALGFAIAITPLGVLSLNNPELQGTGINGTTLALALMASTASTVGIHYFFSAYVRKLYLHKPPNISTLTPMAITPYTKITMETHSLFARTRLTTLQLKDLLPVLGKRTITWKVKKSYLNNCIKAGVVPPRQKRFWLDVESAKTDDVDIVKDMIKVVKEDNIVNNLI
ncbi:10033_t:CDS:2 [Acaulospora morrowiae]|uniref:10033_t:CDS:1 n=1 Tax=Acaulospora morrowiae TaxID=94023 RepID=A0A9N8VPS4_9GLOM|nr:10033_t:CDS:2 [Acaulospora morrowiae]